jgi:hypothetical protein
VVQTVAFQGKNYEFIECVFVLVPDVFFAIEDVFGFVGLETSLEAEIFETEFASFEDVDDDGPADL